MPPEISIDNLGLLSLINFIASPTEFNDQCKLPIAKNSKATQISNFCFYYQNILGGNQEHMYEMSKEMEGTILFFPSQLLHTVYPFYNCEEDRISISGNITLEPKVKEGDMIIFPSWLEHAAPLNKSSKLRATISFNFFFDNE